MDDIIPPLKMASEEEEDHPEEEEEETVPKELIDNSPAFLCSVSNLLVTSQFSDITLKVGNRVFQVHKLFLVNASDVFRVMLTHDNWVEAQQKVIELKEDPKCEAVFAEFLHYMYSGQIYMNMETVLPILVLADKYNVTNLKDLCVNFMTQHLAADSNSTHAVSWFQQAHMFHHKNLEEKCHKFIVWNMETVIKSPDWLNWGKKPLLTLLQSSDIVIHDEFSLYIAVEAWIREECGPNLGRAKDLLTEFLPHIRFPMMTPQQLLQLESTQFAQQYPDLYTNEISEAFRYHALPRSDRPHNQLQHIKYGCRNYTDNQFSAGLVTEDYSSMPTCELRTLEFETKKSNSNADVDKWGWVVEFYPKGVRWEGCYMHSWVRMQFVEPKESCEVRFILRSTDTETRNVEIAILICGHQRGVEYVEQVVQRRFLFNAENRIMLLNNIIPIQELSSPDSHYLVNDSLKLQIVLKPH
ncbi:BTB/POZ domain-containing protein 17-like isoform X1 [Branchiostoma floridae x Branchiostoma japonicum]